MKAPRLLQSIFSAVGDLYVYKLSKILFGEHVARWAVSFCMDVRILSVFVFCSLLCEYFKKKKKRFLKLLCTGAQWIIISSNVGYVVLNSTVALCTVGELVHVFLHHTRAI